MHSYILNYLIIQGMCSIILFLYGFFPMKKYDGTVATVGSLPETVANIRVNVDELYKPSVGRVVIMVIDALRWDFVEGAEGQLNMPYTASLVAGKKACLLTGKARPPTVTMPRIKAMTTGTIPSFVDVALNLGSSKILEDNLLLQAVQHDMKLIFYGDETWLKLFPDVFTRSEGTTSFYVTDFTEVDDNVTRHLAAELNTEDWRLMILHYLGLDHIGHVEGPYSPLVRPKLQQMDHIVKRIHHSFLTWDKHFSVPSVLVVCGDHGMKNSGSHGGASLEEVLVPLIVISNICSEEMTSGLLGDVLTGSVLQIDLVPTLSMLLGLPVPATSIGKIIPALLHSIPVPQQLYALHYNCKQVATQFENNIANSAAHASYLQYTEAVKLHASWLTSSNSSKFGLDERIAKLYMSALTGMSSELADSLIRFDVPSLVIASGILWQIVLILAMERMPHAVPVMLTFFMNLLFLSLSVLWCSCSQSTSVLCSYSLTTVPVILSVIIFVSVNMSLFLKGTLRSIKFSQILRPDQGQAVFVLGTILHCVSLLSSSFIEEEHQVWYFLWLTFAVTILFELCSALFSKQSSVPVMKTHTSDEKHKLDWVLWCWLGLLFLHRILRKWNQTGDKWASLPDVGDWLVQQEHRAHLSVVLLFGLIAVCCCCLYIRAQYQGKYIWLIEGALYITAVVCVYCYRSAIGNVDTPYAYPHSRGVKEVNIFWVILTLLLTKGIGETLYEMKVQRYSSLCIFGCLLSTLTCCWLLICALLHRSHNVILIVAQVFMSKCVGTIYACYRSHTANMWWLVIAHVWIGTVVYFYQGNSNSLASIDIASGYVGQIEYNPIVVGILLIINTYSAPVLSYLLLVINLISQSQEEGTDRFWEQLYSVHHCLAVLRQLPVAVYVVLMTVLRYHLFVWTVFSPKLLYEAMHTLVISLLMLLTNCLASAVVKDIKVEMRS
ncbi:GPI ethanolamine phosphate transferase 2 isoform X2 [Zootermopsis nevadensis]|uniref:GPI ethanolamine phosphate transferase 2 n=2 Tax=Zootermopsis nevadensis TaxID=136037 RepID=A0A067R4Q3_ZOONE|nr:GPI ethanolamine phosphate transferase 2 isoform X2 [Zootermopsis nevadensis]KDR12958.1 GPI ethanolamine phosphate transferase 2 [Zootermopsis nevadensis]